jgi:hypothetical protein
VKPTRDEGAWFRQPVLWIGAAIFVATLLGCVVTIVLATRNADAPASAASPPR